MTHWNKHKTTPPPCCRYTECEQR